MFKKNDKKPFQVQGIIQSVEKGETQKGVYVGQDDFNIYTIKVSDKAYTYNLSINEKIEFKEGDNVFFRAMKFDTNTKIVAKSLGLKIEIPQDSSFTLSDDMLRKLKERNDSIKSDDKQPITRASTTQFKP